MEETASNILVVSGRLYPATVTWPDIFIAEAVIGSAPLMLIETLGGTAVIGREDLRAADPMAYRILKAHLDGKSLMIIPNDSDGPPLTGRELDILAAMPLEWGGHKCLAEYLDITRRQLQRGLNKLMSKELIESPSKGYYRRL